MKQTFFDSGAVGYGCLSDVLWELRQAEEKHPEWPNDIVHQVAIMVEEAGESMRAALNFVYEGDSIEHLRKELAQTGAMALRTLQHLP